MLRHYKLAKGMHRAFYEISRPAMWEVYSKIGTRIMGNWQVVYPDGPGGSAAYDESYRLARYASLEHWQDTRDPAGMMGTGPFADLAAKSEAARSKLVLGSAGAFYLRGRMAPDVPYYLPALKESYEVVSDSAASTPASSQPRAVRYEKPLAGHEIVVLERTLIREGSFGDFSASQRLLWPFLSKLGVRVLGEWLVVKPDPVHDSMAAREDGCDEVLSMARYASYQHWQAVQDPVALGGNGRDFEAFESALKSRLGLTLRSERTFLSGYRYDNPAQFAPPIAERYQARL